MDKIYKPEDIEQSIYKNWEEKGYFKPQYNNKDSYCIVMPPPNITGNLHMGHAFQQTIMDVLIRYQRMQGKNTLWQMGTDHAGIATQMIIERKIFTEENKLRLDYGRDKFIEKIWEWKQKYSIIINNQIRRLGNSVDWTRERFTMDAGFSHAVKESFIKLYQDNLIYRSKKLVNWDSKLNTVISDLEIEHREYHGYIWYLRYPLAHGIRTINGLNYITVATTRPETILGDVCIAINPEDQRFNNLIGQYVIIPLMQCYIPIIADKHVNINTYTGCMKITPAHDFHDYDIAKRHNLPMINVFTFDGNICINAEIFDPYDNVNQNTLTRIIPNELQGLNRFVARKKIITAFKHLGLLEDVKEHYFTIPYGDRSGVIIEPMLTNQWYIRMLPFKKLSVKIIQQKKISFISKQYKNMYLNWMNNIQDWCISRQLWWGHRIPAWYDDHTGKIYVGHNESEIRKHNKLDDKIVLRQDDDVLDTWFSSGLWTFSALGWPDNNNEVNIFHPTNVIVSGFDIIFFWIARMIFLTMYLLKDKAGNSQIPFKFIYITGLIRDAEGNKMSKSKGNVIDPLDIINGISLNDLIKKRTSHMLKPQLANKISIMTKKQFPYGIKAYGTDALRFTLLSIASTGRDINWDMKRLEGYRNFCNKLWNASRFVLLHAQEKNHCNNNIQDLSLVDKWITAKFHQTIYKFRASLDNYRFDIAAYVLYDFTWNHFCDWYLEFIKPIIHDNIKTEFQSTKFTLVNILESLLRLAHPIMPFITEIIWQQIKNIAGKHGDTIMLQSFPCCKKNKIDNNAITNFNWIKQIITLIRNTRAEMNIANNQLIAIFIRNISVKHKNLINDNMNIILSIAKLSSITILSVKEQNPMLSVIKKINEIELIIPIEGVINKEDVLNKLSKKLISANKKIDVLSNKLQDKNFIKFAPKKIIIKEQKKMNYYKKTKVHILEQQKNIININHL